MKIRLIGLTGRREPPFSKANDETHRCRGLIVLVVLAAFLLSVIVAPGMAQAYDTDSNRSAMGMTGDLILLRPLGFAATVIGAAVFVVSLPFSLIGKNVNEASQKLIVEPFLFTFDRPLGELPDSGGLE